MFHFLKYSLPASIVGYHGTVVDFTARKSWRALFIISQGEHLPQSFASSGKTNSPIENNWVRNLEVEQKSLSATEDIWYPAAWEESLMKKKKEQGKRVSWIVLPSRLGKLRDILLQSFSATL